jgi:exonuclease III
VTDALRLATWNCCRGPYARKVPMLDTVAPDVAVLQECGRPAEAADPARVAWSGDRPRQGIAVVARGAWRVEPLPPEPGVPRYAVPVQVRGPRDFLVLAVWSQKDREHPYVEAVVRAVHLYRDRIAAQPTVLAGDLNSSAIWDHQHRPDRSHTALVGLLGELGLVSAYHAFHGEAHGAETRPTFYLTWKRARPFHLDYCFLPAAWLTAVRDVHVGGFDEWSHASDHRPVVVDLALDRVPG